MSKPLTGAQIAKLQEVELELRRIGEVLDGDHDPNRLFAEASTLRNLAEDLRFYILKDNEPTGEWGTQ